MKNNNIIRAVLSIFMIAQASGQNLIPQPLKKALPPGGGGGSTTIYPENFQASFGGSGDDGGNFTTVYSTDLKVIPNGLIFGGLSNSPISATKSQASKGGNDYWVVKTDRNGVKIWDKVYGGSGDDKLNQIFPTSDGGYLLVGSSTSGKSGDKTSASFGFLDVWIVKINASGNVLWDKSYGGSGPDDAVAKNVYEISGKYYIGVSSNSDVSGNKTVASFGAADYGIIALNSSNGNIVMEKSYGGGDNDDLHSIHVNSDGSFVLFGSSSSPADGIKTTDNIGGFGLWDYWAISCNAAGTILWQKSFGGDNDDFLTDARIVKRTNGTSFFVLGGRSDSEINPGGGKSETTHGKSDIWLVAIETNGTKIWDRTYGGTESDDLLTIDLSSRPGLFINSPAYTDQLLLSGYSNSDAYASPNGYKTDDNMGPSDGWLVLVNPTNGQQIKDFSIGGNSDDALQTTKIVNTNPSTGDADYYSLSFTATGVNGTKSTPALGSYDMWLYSFRRHTYTFQGKSILPEQNSSIKVFPTSLKNGEPLQISVDNAEVAKVMVYNMNGQQIFAKNMQSGESTAIKIPFASAGVYIVSITDKDDTLIHQQKIIVN